MKRILGFVMAMILMACIPAALAAPGNAILGRGTNGSYDVYYSSAFAIGDTLYLMDSDSISTWHTGDAEVVSYALRYPAEEDEADVSWSCWPFAANDTLYAIALATRYGEHTEFLRAVLCTVTLVSEDDGNVALLSEHRTLDWSDMIDRYEQDSTARGPQYCVGSGNTAWDIAQANIDWYRANDQHIVMQTVDWLINETDDDAGSFVDRYLAGQMDADAMLANIDNKLNAARIKE